MSDECCSRTCPNPDAAEMAARRHGPHRRREPMRAMPTKPPFAYYGGKTSIADRIVALLPDHRHYVEPFAGSLAVLLAKPRAQFETVNDLDGRLVTFWRVLRDRPAELAYACATTPHSRAEHALSLDLDVEDEIELARRIWVRVAQGRGGQLRTRTGWRFYRDATRRSSSMPATLAAYADRMWDVAERIAAVSLECRPALDLIRDYGQHPDVLLYLDPPYLGETRSTGARYVHEMRSEAEHRELADAVRRVRASVVLSGYDSALYRDLYAGWYRHEIPHFTGQGQVGRSARTEVLWLSRPPRDSLFTSDLDDEEVL